MEFELTISALSKRTGVATSALRFYEREQLIAATRTSGNQRRFKRDVIRRVSFIRIAQQVGLSLDEIRAALDELPARRTPTEHDWRRLSASWRPRLEAEIALIEKLRDRLVGCIGCGCLSLSSCQMMNPSDRAGAAGPGPRFLIAPPTRRTRMR